MSFTPHAPTEAERDQPSPVVTILVVEDEFEVRKVVRLTLELQGYRVFTAQDAEAALHLASAHQEPIDLLLTDVVMPHMSGPRLFERLRNSRPDMRVLFISGYSEDVVADHGVSTKDFKYLAKPFSSSALGRKVRELLKHPAT